MTWPAWLAAVLAMLGLTAVCLRAYGARRWAAETVLLQGRLQRARAGPKRVGAPSPTRFDARELVGLPGPVQRFFGAVLKPGQPLIATVSIAMSGRINLSPTDVRWRPFESRQWVTLQRPGFLWDATIPLLPGMPVRVVDSFIAGKGLLHAALHGLFSVAKLQGRGEIARGEFMRWFAEAAWYPTALLPSQGVHWQAVDDHSALATMVEGPLTVTLLIRFNEAGLIASFRAEARASVVDGHEVMAPWEGRWSNYQWRHGMQVPCTGEVAWIRPEGRRPYFEGTVTTLCCKYLP